MKSNKITTYNLEKCYAISLLNYKNDSHIVVAAEKQDACLMFDLDGNLIEKIWNGPGGTMSIVPLPNREGEFLATQLFYSPNDSKEAKIVYVKKGEEKWNVTTVAKIPFLHRFDIVQRENEYYIIGCTLKTGHEFKEDWSSPGMVCVATLPNDIELYNEENQIEFQIIKDGLLKNHGYFKAKDENGEYSLIATENGVFMIRPPKSLQNNWEIVQLISEPTSDMALCDFDGDGELEMITIANFHGDQIKIFKQNNGIYEEQYKYEEKTEFAHGIWSCDVEGIGVAFIGHRKGKRNLLGFSFKDGKYQVDVLDENIGPANILYYSKNAEHYLVSTNREIDEIAFYKLEI
ncbi:MAG: hypothetical protein ACRC7V_02290 [Lachnospiraceae bacterium]